MSNGFDESTRSEIYKIFKGFCVLCEKELRNNEGQCAHIISISDKEKGPRHYKNEKYYEHLKKEDAEIIFNSSINGLLLCYGCHKKIDNKNNVDIYKTNFLYKLKYCFLKKFDNVHVLPKYYNSMYNIIEKAVYDIKTKKKRQKPSLSSNE